MFRMKNGILQENRAGKWRAMPLPLSPADVSAVLTYLLSVVEEQKRQIEELQFPESMR